MGHMEERFRIDVFLFERLAFLEIVEAMNKASVEPHAEDVRAKISPKMVRQADVIQNFCSPRRSVAAVGAAAVGAVMEEEPEGQPQGLGNASTEKYGGIPRYVDTHGQVRGRISFERTVRPVGS